METLNLIPKDGQWTQERVQSYYLQQIAKTLESIERQNKAGDRAYELLSAERESHGISRIALSLMLYKSEIMGICGSEGVVQMSALIKGLRERRILVWASREELSKAISTVDYLEVEKVGNGFRVRLIKGE